MSIRTSQLLFLTLPVLAQMGCSIENDVPEFKAPELNTSDLRAPELVPTADLLVAFPTGKDEDYEQTFRAVELRKNALLRRAGAL